MITLQVPIKRHTIIIGILVYQTIIHRDKLAPWEDIQRKDTRRGWGQYQLKDMEVINCPPITTTPTTPTTRSTTQDTVEGKGGLSWPWFSCSLVL